MMIMLEEIFERVSYSHKYSIVSIDLDYYIRYCIRFDKEIISAIAEKIRDFFKHEYKEYFFQPDVLDDFYYIVLPEMEYQDSVGEIDKIRKSFRKQRFLASLSTQYERVRMDFSAGVASFPQHGSNFEEVCRMSLVALNHAKAMRRGCVISAPNMTVSPLQQIRYFQKTKFSIMLGKYGRRGMCDCNYVPYEEVLLDEPQAIAVHGSDVYIADQNNHCIILCRDGYARRIVGSGKYGYAGDGSRAIDAYLNKPTGLCVHDKTLYITDTGNDVVRKVLLDTETIETVAGCNEPGYTGDGGAAQNARLNKPGGIDVDSEGNIYINDIANNVIRMIDSSGIITTYAGTGNYGSDGDGGRAVYASFGEIYGICVDRRNGDLYLTDYLNNKIRKIDKGTGNIDTVIGTGEEGYSGDGGPPKVAKLNRPVAVHVDLYGNVYWTESGNNCVRVLIERENRVYTIGGTGRYGVERENFTDTLFSLANPNAVTIDNNNNILIVEGSSNRLVKICMRGNDE